MKNARKLFRLFKSLNEYHKITGLLGKANPSQVDMLNAASRAAFGLYWFFDNLTVLGTVKLLLKFKKSSLPKLSNKIGNMVRTNSEALMPVTAMDKKTDYSKGVAIGSILHIGEHSHLEPVRYSKGSGIWRLMMLPRV